MIVDGNGIGESSKLAPIASYDNRAGDVSLEEERLVSDVEHSLWPVSAMAIML